MTNIWKRSMSMFLTLVMVFGMLPLHVLADDDVTPVDTTPTESHEHSYAYACSTVCETCGEGAREASHEYVDGKCACGATDPDYVAPACEHSYAYACSTVCETCGEGAREASHEYVEGKCACGATDPDYAAPACEHIYAYACSTVCETCGEGVREASHEYVEGKCACGAEDPEYIAPHECVYADGKCETCGADKPASSEKPETVNVSDLAGLLAALASDSELPILVTGQIEIEEDTILDLNGKTVSGTHADAYSMIHVQNGAELTVNGEGTITYAPGGNNTGAAIWVEGALIQNGGTIEVTGEWSFGFAVDLRPNAWGTAHTEPASFVMNDGKIKSTDTAVRVASNSSDDYEELGVSFTMEDGQIESEWDAVFVQHLYASDLDVEIIDGAVSGTNSVLRIYGGSGSDIAMNIKGGSFDGGVKIADDYVDAKPIAITGGTFSADVSAYVADGYVQDADGNVTTAPAEPEVPIVIPENIVDTIVGENAAEEQKADVQAIVDEIAANTALTDESYKPVAHIAGVERLVVTLSGMVKEDTAAPSRITFTVEPKNADGEKVSQPGSSITFRLPVPASVTHSHAKVFHGNDLMGTFEIKGSGTGKYIEVSSESFSEFTSEFVTPVEEVELPAVTVTDIKPTLTADDPDLTFALNFAIEDLENIQNDQEYLDKLFNTYGRYYTDYVLTISGLDQESVTFNANGSADGYLAGQYDEYGENWLAVPFEDVTVENGNSLYIMAYASKLLNQSGLRFTLEEVAELVQNFDCGVYFTPEFLAANPDMEVTLELKVFTEDAEENLADDHCVAINKFNVKDIVAVVTGHGKQTEYYTSFAAALTGAEADDTIKLLHNTTENWVTVKKDVTLDLNGCVLEAEYVSCFGSIVDSDAAKGGTLKVEKKKLLIQQSNAMLPVKTAEGYKFVEVKGFNKMLMENGKFVFQPLFEASNHALLAAGVDVTGVTVNVRINWTQDQGARSQGFVYNDEMLTKFVNSYRAETGKYGQMLTLLLKGTEGLADLTYIAQVKSDTGVIIETEGVAPEKKPAEDETGNVTKDENNQVAEQVTITNDDQTSAVVPEGTKLDENTTNLTLVVTEVNESESNITLGKNEAQKSVDVHIEGVASDNAVPMTITLPKFAEAGLNEGNIHIYHVENGETVEMTRVDTIVAFTAHNQYWYDPVTGDVVLYMATFSEITVVSDTVNAWNGNFDYSWYTNAVAPAAEGETADYIIANADQLAAFGAIVGGMNGQKQDSFTGKTVKLIADIDLGGSDEEEDDEIFYPIGYNSSDGKYEKTGVAVTTGFYTFEGTFDGQGHTISNIYQNTWEMKGDNNYYDATLQYYRDGMGLFGKVYGGTVKNLTVTKFKSDGEYTTTGVIAAYADGATFENIAIFDCNPRVYNTGNGGIVGCVGWYAKVADLKTTFSNITVDNSNKISALWGSYDVACGGIVGQYYPTSGQTSVGSPKNAGVHFDNCHVSAIMDVYNDVCANYQYYAYRYTGMLIGSVRENETIDGHVYPKMDGITATDCTVNFGDWNDYYYCELVANSLASYTHDHQFSRLEQVASVDKANNRVTSLAGVTTSIPTSGRYNYVVVNGEHGTNNATCFHFVDGKVHNHDDYNGDGVEDYETVNGESLRVENNRHIYLEFNNLFTGYGWGVTSRGLSDFDGVETMGISEGTQQASVEKFKGKVTELPNNTEIKIGDIFSFVDNGVELAPDALVVSVTNLDENNPVSAVFTKDKENWENGTLKLTGIGKVKITIQDYYFCTPTTITVTITEQQAEEKFVSKIEREYDFLYRVGNIDNFPVGVLFEAMEGAEIDTANVVVTVTSETEGITSTYTPNTTDWTKGSLKINGAGLVTISITDNDYCKPTSVTVEVVTAKNAFGTTVPGATSANVVLLENITDRSITVSGPYWFYGNGCYANYTDQGSYASLSLNVGYVTVEKGGTLDNVKVKCKLFPEAYMFRKEAESSGSPYNYSKPAVTVTGDSTISGCYIYGARVNIQVREGNVTIRDTITDSGALANIHIVSGDAYTVTLDDVTTIQKMKTADFDSDKNVLGFAVAVGTTDSISNPTIKLTGDLRQYNWVTKKDANDATGTYSSGIINGALAVERYQHSINGETSVNLGIAYVMKDLGIEIKDDRTNKDAIPYELNEVTMKILGNKLTGKVYSIVNSETAAARNDADKENVVSGMVSTNSTYIPQYAIVSNLGGQVDSDETDDTSCVYKDGAIKVMFPSGESKELNLDTLVSITKYTGQSLIKTIAVKDEIGNNVNVINGKIFLSAAGEYTITYSVTDDVIYDQNGGVLNNGQSRATTVDNGDGTITYSWTLPLLVSLKDTAVPDARFEFDATKQKMGYYKPTIGDVKQYLPFLAGLKIYDYNGKTEYLRFDGSNDFNKVASITITGYASNKASVEVKLTDGGVINTQFLARANSGGGSTYTGKIKTNDNTIYFVTDSGTSNKDTTTTAAYWYVDFYKFTGNNGVAIQSAQQTFNSTGSSASTPSGNFSTTIKYTVTYDANEGNCGQAVGYATSASAAVTLPTPTRSGYIFAGWYTAASGGTRVGGAGESYTPSANVTLYAQWGKPCTVTYNANGGSCGTASEKYTGAALTLPTPTRDGYWFVGWYDAAEGGNKIGDAGATYNPSGEVTLYAHWQEKVEYTVTYNANGGTCGTASATYQGTALTLPTPTRTGYTFKGWYTAASGGTKIGDAGASYTPSANITLYAQWEQISYTITIEKQSNATVTVDKTTAYYGDTVSVTVSFSLSSSKTLTVKDASNNTVLSKNEAGTYTFTMPASNVTISASSSSGCVTPDTLITLADGTQKRVDELNVADKILAWDFFAGTYVERNISLLVNHGESTYQVANLEFSDGTVLRLIADHGVFDYDLNKFVYITVDNMNSYVGHRFVQYSADGSYNIVTLCKAYETEEVTSAYSVSSAVTSNAFASGMLTVAPPEDFYNWIEMDGKLHYDVEKFNADVEKYGLYTYDLFADHVTYEQFVDWNGAYLKIPVEKGLFSLEYIFELIELYVSYMPN